MPKNTRKPVIKFESKLLDDLVNVKSSCVKIKSLKYHLALHPYHLNDVNSSLKEVLGEGITKFNNKLGGILLGFKNVKLLSDVCQINYDSCYIHVDVTADFYLFLPKVDKKLKGVVTKRTNKHVSCLLYKAFNISIPKPKNAEQWLGDDVKPGFEVLFKITQIDFSRQSMPYICGTIVSILTTCEQPTTNKKIVFKNQEEDKEELNEKAKQVICEANDLSDFMDPTIVKKTKKKKKKEALELEDTSVKKSKKLKKEKQADISLGELKLSDLFSSNNVDINKSSGDIVHNDHRLKRKRENSTSDLRYVDDHILDYIIDNSSPISCIDDTPKLKRKKTVSVSDE